MVILRAKLIVTGEPTVGKSALVQTFHSDGSHFPKNYTMTVGCELSVKSVNIPESSDSVELYMYDSAGKEVFADMVQQFWDQPNVVMVVYDVTSEQSFNACKKWLERCRAKQPDLLFPGALVGNKIDLQQRRVISTKQGMDLASSLNLEYFECSAKEGDSVEAPFFFLAHEFQKLYREKLEVLQTLT